VAPGEVGVVPTVVESCVLGCFGSEPRCREIDPSNDFAMYLDMVPDPPAVMIENGSFNVDSGTVFNNGVMIDVPSFMVPAPTNGVATRVFVVDTLSITQASTVTAAAPATGPALVILARGDIEISGQLAAPRTGTATVTACNAGPGLGPTGTLTYECNYSASASGGGGFATNGGNGGDLNSYGGGSGGIANGNEQLIPLRGGCSSGARHPVGTASRTSGFGGGAIQLVSRTRIVVDGIVDVTGANGSASSWACPATAEGGLGNCRTRAGGGAGGAILLEAPKVELGPNASLTALGGDGGTACQGAICSSSGTGASPGVAATSGANLSSSCSAANGDVHYIPGSGGGGLGRIRINTADGTYVKANSAVESGDTSVGTIATR